MDLQHSSDSLSAEVAVEPTDNPKSNLNTSSETLVSLQEVVEVPEMGNYPIPMDPRKVHRRRTRRKKVASSVGSGSQISSRPQIDARVLECVTRNSNENPETFLKSLAPHLYRVPQDLQIRTQIAILSIIEAATPPNDPGEIFWAIDNCRMRSQQRSYVPYPVPVPSTRRMHTSDPALQGNGV